MVKPILVKCIVCKELFKGDIIDFISGKIEICEECRKTRTRVER